jgi:hypothetical protein
MIEPRRIPAPVWTFMIALLAAASPAWTRNALAQPTDETAVEESGGPAETDAEAPPADDENMDDDDGPQTELASVGSSTAAVADAYDDEGGKEDSDEEDEDEALDQAIITASSAPVPSSTSINLPLTK